MHGVITGGHPKYRDGKLYVQSDVFPLGSYACFPGIGDDISTTNGRFKGTPFRIQSSAIEEKTVTVRFKECVHIAGGSIKYDGATYGDELTFAITAPATTGVSNPGSGAFNKVEVAPGAHIYVPAPATDGQWDVDLTETYNEHVAFTKAVPVPSAKVGGVGTGYFDLSDCAEDLTINPQVQGTHNLFDFPVELGWMVPKAQLMGEGIIDIRPRATPKWSLPQWKYKVIVNHTVASPVLSIIWGLDVSRKTIQPE